MNKLSRFILLLAAVFFGVMGSFAQTWVTETPVHGVYYLKSVNKGEFVRMYDGKPGITASINDATAFSLNPADDKTTFAFGTAPLHYLYAEGGGFKESTAAIEWNIERNGDYTRLWYLDGSTHRYMSYGSGTFTATTSLDGTKPDFILISQFQREDELARQALIAGYNLKEGFPVDISGYIKNRGIASNSTDFIPFGWTENVYGTGIDGKGNPREDGMRTAGTGNSALRYRYYSSGGSFDYSQTLTGLPAGRYLVTVDMEGDQQGGDVGLYVQQGVNEYSDGYSYVHTTPRVGFVSDGSAFTIGVKNLQTMRREWIQADNFHLEYLGPVRGTDMTSYITNPDATDGTTGWTWTKEDANWAGATPSNADSFDGNLFEPGPWNFRTGSIAQTVNNLPAGQYKLSVRGMASDGVQMFLSANDFSAQANGVGNVSTNGGDIDVAWKELSVHTTLLSVGDLSIVASASTTVANKWANFDHFTLTYEGNVVSDCAIGNDASVDTEIEGGRWFKLTDAPAGKYALFSTAPVYYTTDGSKYITDDDFTKYNPGASVDIVAGSTIYFFCPSSSYSLKLQSEMMTTGMDVTYKIVNPSFETSYLTPWTTTGKNDTGVKPNSNGTYTTTGVDGDYLFNTWDNGNGYPVTQNIGPLPEGKYILKAKVASDAGNKIALTVNGVSSDLLAVEGPKTVFQEITYPFTVSGTGDVTIGSTSATWYKIDDFKLYYKGISTIADEADGHDFGNGNNASISQWYKMDVEKGLYFVYSDPSATITYTQDGMKTIKDSDFPTTKGNNDANSYIELEAGTLYFSSSATAKVAFGKVVFLQTQDGKKYMTNGGSWNTQMVVDDWGAPFALFKLTGNKTALFNCTINAFLGANDAGTHVDIDPTNGVYTDGGLTTIYDRLTYAVPSAGKIQITQNGKYLSADAEGYGTLQTGAYTWNVIEPSAHKTAMQALKDTQAKNAAAATSWPALAGVTTAAGLQGTLSDNAFIEFQFHAPASTKKVDEAYWPDGDLWPRNWDTDYYKELGKITLPAGIYQIFVQGFARSTTKELSTILYNNDADVSGTHLYFGDGKAMLMSVNSYRDGDANSGTLEADGRYYPNGMGQAFAAFKNRSYDDNNLWVYISEPGEYTYGIRSERAVGRNEWACWNEQSIQVKGYSQRLKGGKWDRLLPYIKKFTTLNSIMHSEALETDLHAARTQYLVATGEESDAVIDALIASLERHISATTWDDTRYTVNNTYGDNWVGTTDANVITVKTTMGSDASLHNVTAPSHGMFAETKLLIWDFKGYTDAHVTANALTSYSSLNADLSRLSFKGQDDNDYITNGGFRIANTSSAENRYVKYTPEDDGVLTVYFKSNSKDAVRTMAIAESVITGAEPAGVVTYAKTVSNNVVSMSALLKAGTTYYIYSANGGQTITKLTYVAKHGDDAGQVIGASAQDGGVAEFRATFNDLPAGHYILYFETYNGNMGHETLMDMNNVLSFRGTGSVYDGAPKGLKSGSATEKVLTNADADEYYWRNNLDNTHAYYQSGEWQPSVMELDIHERGNYKFWVGLRAGTREAIEYPQVWYRNFTFYREYEEVPAEADRILKNNQIGYLKTATGEYLQRSSNYGTQTGYGVLGVPMQVFNNPDVNTTRFKFFDNQAYLYGANVDGNGIYTDFPYPAFGPGAGDGNAGDCGNFRLERMSDETFSIYSIDLGLYVVKGADGLVATSETPYPWTFESPKDYLQNIQDRKDRYFAAAAQDLGYNDVHGQDDWTHLISTWGLGEGDAFIPVSITDVHTNTLAESYQANNYNKMPSFSLDGLTNGLYRVTLEGFSRLNGYESTAKYYNGDGADGYSYATPYTYIQANEVISPFMSIYDENNHGRFDHSSDVPVTIHSQAGRYPNSMDGAAAHFNVGQYKNVVWVYVTDGTLEIALHEPRSLAYGNWTIWRNFTVERLKAPLPVGADATVYILNPGFEADDVATATPKGWTISDTPAASDVSTHSTNSTVYATAGSKGKFLLNMWDKGPAATTVLHDLPRGTFLLTADVATSSVWGSGNVYLTVEATHSEPYSVDNQHVFGKAAMILEAPIAKDYTIGIVGGTADGTLDGSSWYKADNFRLISLGRSDAEYTLKDRSDYLFKLFETCQPWADGDYKTQFDTYTSTFTHKYTESESTSMAAAARATLVAQMDEAILYITRNYPTYAWQNASKDHPYDLTDLIINSNCQANEDGDRGWLGNGRVLTSGSHYISDSYQYFAQNHENGAARTQDIAIAPLGYYLLRTAVRGTNANSYATISIGNKAETTKGVTTTSTVAAADGLKNNWTYSDIYFGTTNERQAKEIAIALSNVNNGREANVGGMWLYYLGARYDEIVDTDYSKVHYYYGDWRNEVMHTTDDVPVLDITEGYVNNNGFSRTNTNGIAYLAEGSHLFDNPSNVVINGVAASLELDDTHPFYAHKSFEATNATYHLAKVASDGGDRNLATLMVPFAVAQGGQPEDNTAFSVDQALSAGHDVQATKVDAIAANTPVIVTKPGDYKASTVSVAATPKAEYTNGHLVGTYKGIAAAEVGTYVLQVHGTAPNERVAFYLVGRPVLEETPTPPSIKPFHGYIEGLGSVNNVRGIGFNIMDADNIDVILEYDEEEEEASTTGALTAKGSYDLSGRPVVKPQHGVYIVNGKKVVVK